MDYNLSMWIYKSAPELDNWSNASNLVDSEHSSEPYSGYVHNHGVLLSYFLSYHTHDYLWKYEIVFISVQCSTKCIIFQRL